MMEGQYRNSITLLLLLACMVLISCGGDGDGGIYQVSNTNFEEEEPFSFQVPVENRSQFKLVGVSGEISITGRSESTPVVITGKKRVQSESTQDAKEHLQKLEVEIQSLPDEVYVRTIQPNETGGREYIIDYTITLPKDLKILVINTNGNVTLDNIENDVAVNNIGGKVVLMNIVGGALINLLSGTIESKVTLPLKGTIEMTTLTGDIKLAIPENTSAQFSAAVTLGKISVSTNLVLQGGERRSNFWGGKLGDGEGTISLEAKKTGDIIVTGF